MLKGGHKTTWHSTDIPAVFVQICSFDICHETELRNTNMYQKMQIMPSETDVAPKALSG